MRSLRPPVSSLSKTVVLLALAFVAAALAGCLGSGSDEERPNEVEDPRPAIVPAQDVRPIAGDPIPGGPGHDHANPAQHDVAINMELLGRPEVDPAGKGTYWNSNIPMGLDIRFGELDVKGDWLAQCSREENGGYLWDIVNRSSPVLAARIPDVGNCPDLKLTDDANFLVVGGNKLYNLSDKGAPEQVFKTDEFGCHMCSLITVDGQEYVILSAQGSATNVGGRNVTTGAGFAVVRLVRDPPAMEVVGRWQKELARDSVPTLAEQDIANTVHDQYAYHDQVLGKPIVVTAMWDYGVFFVDLSDPAAPKDLGHWGDYGGDAGNIHTVAVDFRKVSGELRRIAVAATETGPIIGAKSAADPGYVYVLDATDLDHVKLLSTITLPGEVFVDGIRFSTHNHQLVNGRLYVAWYHAGVWAYDVSTDEKLLAPELVGFYLPHENVTATPEGADVPDTWDVVVTNGVAWASDVNTGLIALRFAGDTVGDGNQTSLG
ncbi:MAG: LVIVD repeat-containing protein [bacterium]